MSNKAVGLSALVLAVVVGGIVWMQEARKNEASQHGVSSEKNKSSTEKMSGSSGLAASAQSFTQSSASSIRHPFPEIPRTRDGMSFENDPGFAESKAEQKWLDRHGYPNEKQLEAYMLAPEALLKQAAEAGDIAAQAMLDARLLPTDPKAQQRLVDAGAEGNLFALNMLASYQGECQWRSCGGLCGVACGGNAGRCPSRNNQRSHDRKAPYDRAENAWRI